MSASRRPSVAPTTGTPDGVRPVLGAPALRAALDRSVVGTLLLRPGAPGHLHAVAANPAAAARLGGVPEELLGLGWSHRLASGDRVRLASAAREVFDGTLAGQQVEIAVPSGGRVRVCLGRIDAVPGRHEPLVMAQLLDCAEPAAVDHELRTPITSVLGYSELLREGAAGQLNQSQLALLARVEGSARRLLGLVDDLLRIDRLDSGEAGAGDDDVPLDDVVRRAVKAVGLDGRGRDLVLNARVARGPHVVRGDAAALERVVVELLSNAVKFTPAGGRITIGLDREGADAVLAVQDTGPGVPNHEQPRLFDRFFRSSAAPAQHAPGSGLGLTAVRSVVVAHGGSVGVTSGTTGGARFEVRLPLAPAA